MKFIINSTLLLKELQKISGVLSSNNTLPILDNFLFDINSGKINIIASDLETTIITKLENKTSDDGQITIPAKILIDTLKTFSNQPLTFIVNEETKAVEISSDNGNYQLSGQDANEFPKIPAVQDSLSIRIDSKILNSSINKTLFACGNDELRPVMSGLYCEFKSDSVTFVATDAHKLVRQIRNDLSSEKSSSFILPKKPINLLKNLLVKSDVKIDYNETNVLFTFDNITMICRLIDGKYPNYEAVIPKENPNKLYIETDLLLRSIKRVSIFANKTTHQIRLKIAGSELQITSEDLDFSNKAEERLICKYEGEDIEIGFNSKFIIEMLNNIGSKEICLEMSTPNRAGIIIPQDGLDEGEETLMLVMPVMLNT